MARVHEGPPGALLAWVEPVGFGLHAPIVAIC
jgi:hypothetical protein